MADQENSRTDEGAESDESFSPTGTLVLMILYIMTFAAAWASVYFFELLARR